MLLALAQGGAGVLHLRTFQRNEGARRFYEKHGFRAVEETDGAGNAEKEPDVLYRRSPPAPSDVSGEERP